MNDVPAQDCVEPDFCLMLLLTLSNEYGDHVKSADDINLRALASILENRIKTESYDKSEE